MPAGRRAMSIATPMSHVLKTKTCVLLAAWCLCVLVVIGAMLAAYCLDAWLLLALPLAYLFMVLGVGLICLSGLVLVISNNQKHWAWARAVSYCSSIVVFAALVTWFGFPDTVAELRLTALRERFQRPESNRQLGLWIDDAKTKLDRKAGEQDTTLSIAELPEVLKRLPRAPTPRMSILCKDPETGAVFAKIGWGTRDSYYGVLIASPGFSYADHFGHFEKFVGCSDQVAVFVR